jgi:hypothetical protein
VVYQEQLAKLRPSFDDCPKPCAQSAEEGRPADLPEICAACEVGVQWKYFREAVEFELEQRCRGEGRTFDSLLSDVLELSGINESVRGRGYPKNVDALTARCLEILRREDKRPRRIYLWELSQKRTKE